MMAFLMQLMKMNIAIVGRANIDRFDFEADEAKFDATFPTSAPRTFDDRCRFLGFESGHEFDPR
jgi:hypothetical protein